jgi:hypothetical protein
MMRFGGLEGRCVRLSRGGRGATWDVSAATAAQSADARSTMPEAALAAPDSSGRSLG